MQDSFWKSICRRKFFWLTLPQKNFILYMKIEGLMTYYSCILLQKEFHIFQNVYFRWKYISQVLWYFEVRAREKNLFFIGPSLKVRYRALFLKIATSAVNLARILLPRMVWSISFWEQCSRAPPLFAPLECTLHC